MLLIIKTIVGAGFLIWAGHMINKLYEELVLQKKSWQEVGQLILKIIITVVLVILILYYI